jgi:hypothetical protein
MRVHNSIMNFDRIMNLFVLRKIYIIKTYKLLSNNENS